ncbi:MAG: ABC transporter permease [Bacteroidales bacterium]|nr:ABC transporter permease [Bacteroidales bacterium]
MFWNLLKTTFRNLIKNKAFILLNVLGLTIGLAVFSAIVLFIQYEFSYEKTHKHIDNIYRIEQFWTGGGQKQNMCGTPPPLCPVLINDFPEIEKATPISIWRSIIVENEKHEKMRESTILFVDKDFLEMFTINRISGDPDGSLSEPYTGVISRKTAEKYFGDKNPVGKTLKINNQFAVEIRTVVEDLPENTHLKFNILISFPTLRELFGDEVVTNDWYSNWIRNYVMVAKNADITGLNKKIRFYLKNYQGEESENELYLKPLSRIHLYSTVNDEIARVGDINNIKVFSAIGIFILLIACINFINLATARSANRAKEVGMRKVVGAHRLQVIQQFLGESVLLSLLALLLAIALVELSLPMFNALTGKELVIDYGSNLTVSLGLVGITLFVGIVAGSYPAFFLSAFQPVAVLKGTMKAGSQGSFRRKVLVVVQFVISISLIIATGIVDDQLQYMRNKKLGLQQRAGGRYP